MTDNLEAWYIVKQENGQCKVLPDSQLPNDQPAAPNEEKASAVERWGPFASQGEAIARRVGLIRAGKCQPV